MHWNPDAEADPATLVYTFGGAAPVASLAPGTVLSTWTRDCFGGRVRSTADLASQVCDPRYLNPQTGPFYIEGAEPGDTLVVHFLSIEPRHDWGVSTTVPFFGSLTATGLTAMLHEPLAERTWFYELDLTERLVRYSALDTAFQAELPLDPMHGTVGVAPPLGEVRSSLTPGSWGGNMDTPEMRAGTTCYLGVNVEGALLSLGDGHARQGEGETCGVAVECAMDTVLVVELLKAVPTPWPRLEDDSFIMTTGSARPLEDAFRIAHTELVRWVAELIGLSTLDAYQLVSQAALTPVANVVDTNYTVVAKFPKALLPGVDVMGGLHRRLRATRHGRP
ncbi:acetamidase/formamidase family protein [Dactylosporangium matsuzakiense]|uniref:Amidase n=1 Tax=Dactylosporangium matsuzakiense TaxID=53360 RepID=A0A9W6NNB0_9ACTN|nr:acetamidase/formamidase family protein [Dactylosporangium matsuzakiense]GLL02832.1 amidase [Dactylosporangium matsuzakiense]